MHPMRSHRCRCPAGLVPAHEPSGRWSRAQLVSIFFAILRTLGGFLDAIGGGGWGPMVTSTLIGSGHAPRKVIGSVNAAEFFITVAVATTFFIELATAHVEHIAALIIGGLLAAPFAGYIVRYVQPRALMAAVGVLVSALALFQLAKSFG